jgi:hypothetical protein
MREGAEDPEVSKLGESTAAAELDPRVTGDPVDSDVAVG